MHTEYAKDIVAWSREQAALLRASDFAALDLEHIASEIEDVDKSEQRELASGMAVLLAHLLQWQFQPERRRTSWKLIIKDRPPGTAPKPLRILDSAGNRRGQSGESPTSMRSHLPPGILAPRPMSLRQSRS
jgi:hypothetical protein